jgi:gas vesicle protein
MRLTQLLSFVGGLLSGAIVGAAAVTLLAPRPGTETRQQIAAKFQGIADAGKQAMAERRQQLRAEYEEAIRIPLPIGGPEAGQP